METDIDILMGLAHLIEQHVPAVAIYDPVGLVKEFRRTIRREMNFVREGHTIERFANNFANDPTVHVPKVYWQHSGETVLTLEYIDGIKISEFQELTARGFDLKELARRGATAFLKQVLDQGVFHGDPHPGNLFVLPDHVICMLDYGMVGRLSPELKQQLIELIEALLNRVGLSGHFERVVGLEATERHKPDPAPVHHAIDALGARPGEAAFVGDSPHDVEAGNAAGVATVATLWGPFSRAQLAPARPRAWAERVEDVVPVLEGLGIPGV